MTRQEIAEGVIKTTARELHLNASDIKESDNFAMELGADSLKSIELVAAFEEEFGCPVVSVLCGINSPEWKKSKAAGM